MPPEDNNHRKKAIREMERSSWGEREEENMERKTAGVTGMRREVSGGDSRGTRCLFAGRAVDVVDAVEDMLLTNAPIWEEDQDDWWQSQSSDGDIFDSNQLFGSLEGDALGLVYSVLPRPLKATAHWFILLSLLLSVCPYFSVK